VLLGWSQKELAANAGVSVPFIARLERGERLGQATKLRQLRDALLALGVVFEGDEERITVSLRGERARARREAWAREG
jgi:transcriptional regulator with XRE-family HTH domain